jgi:hypothetical protein
MISVSWERIMLIEGDLAASMRRFFSSSLSSSISSADDEPNDGVLLCWYHDSRCESIREVHL